MGRLLLATGAHPVVAEYNLLEATAAFSDRAGMHDAEEPSVPGVAGCVHAYGTELGYAQAVGGTVVAFAVLDDTGAPVLGCGAGYIGRSVGFGVEHAIGVSARRSIAAEEPGVLDDAEQHAVEEALTVTRQKESAATDSLFAQDSLTSLASLPSNAYGREFAEQVLRLLLQVLAVQHRQGAATRGPAEKLMRSPYPFHYFQYQTNSVQDPEAVFVYPKQSGCFDFYQWIHCHEAS